LQAADATHVLQQQQQQYEQQYQFPHAELQPFYYPPHPPGFDDGDGWVRISSRIRTRF
jgi:hypothetical protein